MTGRSSGQPSGMPDHDETPDVGAEDPNRFAEGGNAPLDEGPNAAPGNPNDDPDPGASLPPGAGTKDD